MRVLFRTSAFTKLQTVIVAAIIIAIALCAACYYGGVIVPTSTPSPTPTLIPLPYDALDFYPEPNSTNVSPDTNITMYFTRPPPFIMLQLSPSANGSMNQIDEAEA